MEGWIFRSLFRRVMLFILFKCVNSERDLFIWIILNRYEEVLSGHAK